MSKEEIINIEEEKKNRPSVETCFGRFYALGIKGQGFVYRCDDGFYTYGNSNPAPDDADLIVDNTVKGILRKARAIVNRGGINNMMSDFRSWMDYGLYIAVLEGNLVENGDVYGRYMVTNSEGLMDWDEI